MHDFASFILPALATAALLAAIAAGLELRSRRANRRTVSNNLARAIERTDGPRHAGPRRNRYGNTRTDGNSHGDGNADRSTRTRSTVGNLAQC